MEELIIRPYDWQGLDFTPRYEDETGSVFWGTRSYTIFIWGHNELNEECVWIVNDYSPHMFIRFMDEIENESKHAEAIIKQLDKQLMDYATKAASKNAFYKSLIKQDRIIEGYIAEEKTPMFYHGKGVHKLYKIFFKLEASMQLCNDFLKHNKVKLSKNLSIKVKAFHSGNSDRISNIQKLIVEKNLNRCDWIVGECEETKGDGLTTLKNEYIVSYESLQLLDEKQADEIGFPNPSMISFDAEVYSHIHNRFPNAHNIQDEMYAIGLRHTTFPSIKTLPKNADRHNYILIIWDVENNGELDPKEDIYGKTTMVYAIDEEDFYNKLFKLINKLDPTFLVSYNGTGFDWVYMEERCSLFGIKIPNMSRIRSWNKSRFNEFKFKGMQFRRPNYPGRIDVDMLGVIKRQMFKLNNYKLSTVASALLGETKVDLPYRTQFEMVEGKQINDYNSIVDYLQQDIHLPEALYFKLGTVVYLHENGSVMQVNPTQLLCEGESIRAISLLYRAVVESNRYVDSRTIWKAGKYIGGWVKEAVVGLRENVFSFDFSSLYPSEICANNICYTTKIDEEVDGKLYSDEDCFIIEGDVPIADPKDKKKIIAHEYHKFRFIRNDHNIGLIPTIVKRLNALRSKYKKEMAVAEKHRDQLIEKLSNSSLSPSEVNELKDKIAEAEIQVLIWNVRQMATKVTANSMYGFMGMKTGKYSFIEGGMATTLAGRAAISKAIKIAEEELELEVIYGDTDSIFVTDNLGRINLLNYKDVIKQMEQYISDQFPEGVNIVFENYFHIFLLLAKKKYACIRVNKEAPDVFPSKEVIKKKSLMYVKGLVTVQGNHCGVIYSAFNDILLNILMGTNIEDIFTSIHEHSIRICRREYPLKDYTFSQKLGGNYKNKSAVMSVFADVLKQQGRIHKPKEELEYVYVVMEGYVKYVGQRMQAPDLMVECENVLDTIWYVKNKIASPIEQILCAIFTDDVLEEYVKKIVRPRKPTRVQKVTDHWHLERYIEYYVSGIHENWAKVMAQMKSVRALAIELYDID